ncbi:MAG: ribbon-helix-helix protein, CopG family [Acidobacteriota bacterium]
MMVKTTVYLEAETALALRELARKEARSQAEIIREALHLYTRGKSRPGPTGIGAFRSGRGDVADRAEEYLRTAAGRRR